MNIDAIVYTSKNGHTKEYAEILSKKIDAPILCLEEACKKLNKNSLESVISVMKNLNK